MRLLANNERIINVALSERNLRELLAAVESGQRVRDLYQVQPNRLVLRVQAETDAEHYAERQPGPGLCIADAQ